MFRKILKWTAIGIGTLGLLLLGTYLLAGYDLEQQRRKTYQVQVKSLVFRPDSTLIA